MTPERRAELRIDQTQRTRVSIFFGRAFQVVAGTSWTEEEVLEALSGKGCFTDDKGREYIVIDTIPTGAQNYPESLYIPRDSMIGFAIGLPPRKGLIEVAHPRPPKNFDA